MPDNKSGRPIYSNEKFTVTEINGIIVVAYNNDSVISIDDTGVEYNSAELRHFTSNDGYGGVVLEDGKRMLSYPNGNRAFIDENNKVCSNLYFYEIVETFDEYGVSTIVVDSEEQYIFGTDGVTIKESLDSNKNPIASRDHRSKEEIVMYIYDGLLKKQQDVVDEPEKQKVMLDS